MTVRRGSPPPYRLAVSPPVRQFGRPSVITCGPGRSDSEDAGSDGEVRPEELRTREVIKGQWWWEWGGVVFCIPEMPRLFVCLFLGGLGYVDSLVILHPYPGNVNARSFVSWGLRVMFFFALISLHFHCGNS